MIGVCSLIGNCKNFNTVAYFFCNFFLTTISEEVQGTADKRYAHIVAKIEIQGSIVLDWGNGKISTHLNHTESRLQKCYTLFCVLHRFVWKRWDG